MTAFAVGAATDVGRVRSGNEDAYFVGEALFAVADGMGGHRGGAVAAEVALAALDERFHPTTTHRLVEAVEEANAMVVERAEADPDLAGMGTTLTALALVDDDGRHLLAVVNVGDSRLYLMKEGELEQITEDHSLVATLERQGRITRDEAATHPQRNILTRALGIDGTVMVDSWEIVPFVGDRYLLCSDGLFNELDDHRIAAVLRRLVDPTDAARELVRLANEAGGRDNITCLVVDVVDDAGRDPALTAADGRVASVAPAPDPPGVGAAVARAAGDAVGATDGGDPPRRAGDTAVHEAIGADGGAPGEGPAGSGPDGDARPRRARSRFTWRVALFGVAFVAIIGAAVAAVVYVGTGTYYVGFDGDQVVIFQGRPGGVLWIDPELTEPTDLTRDDLPPSAEIDVDRGKQESSLDDARAYVENLRSQTTTTTSTTTTTTTTTTITTPPAPAAEPQAGEPAILP